jgi:hypothetical protein
MIKQNWNIDDEERRRIINLHESASKKQYLFLEQQVTQQPEVEKTLTPREFAKKYGLMTDEKGDPIQATDKMTIQFNFASGFWSNKANSADGSTTIVTQVTNAVQEVRDFLNKFFIPQITRITIASGESAVPNKDNEAPGSPRLNPGELAKKRSATIQELLTQQLQSVVSDGLVKQLPEIQIAQPVIGSATVRNSPEAIAEQFVSATIEVKGLTRFECDFNLNIEVKYIPVGSDNDKYHNCNDAQFTLLLNNVPITCNETGTDIFSLNNYPSAGARKQTLTVSPEKAKQILGTSETVEVAFKCMSEKCHEAPLVMSVFDDGKKISGPSYMGTAKNRADRMAKGDVRKVATMDNCGKIIKIEDFFSQPDPAATGQTETNKAVATNK